MKVRPKKLGSRLGTDGCVRLRRFPVGALSGDIRPPSSERIAKGKKEGLDG